MPEFPNCSASSGQDELAAKSVLGTYFEICRRTPPPRPPVAPVTRYLSVITTLTYRSVGLWERFYFCVFQMFTFFYSIFSGGSASEPLSLEIDESDDHLKYEDATRRICDCSPHGSSPTIGVFRVDFFSRILSETCRFSGHRLGLLLSFALNSSLCLVKPRISLDTMPQLLAAI